MHSDRPRNVLVSLNIFCLFVELQYTDQHKVADVSISKALLNFVLHDSPPLVLFF